MTPASTVATPDIGTWHPMKSSSMVGSGLTWPYMTDAVDGRLDDDVQPAINTTVDTGNAKQQTNTSSAGKTALTGTNLTAGNTSSKGNTSAKGNTSCKGNTSPRARRHMSPSGSRGTTRT